MLILRILDVARFIRRTILILLHGMIPRRIGRWWVSYVMIIRMAGQCR